MEFTTTTTTVNMQITTIKAVLLQLQHRLPGENVKAHFGHILDQVAIGMTTSYYDSPVFKPGSAADIFQTTKNYIDYVESYRK